MMLRMGLARLGPMLLALASVAACAVAPPSGPRMAPDAVGYAAVGDQRVLGSLSGGQGVQSGGLHLSQTSAVVRGDQRETAEATGTGAELVFVSGILRGLQLQSFAANTEHCGYIGLDAGGNLVSTPINQGDESSCTLPQIPGGMTLLASFHTHGTYSPYYASEFPTTTDMLTDASDNIDGYISTPGGRLWYVDTDTMTVRQLCGRGCLPQDPNYVAADDGPVRQVFTVADLRAFERS